MSLFFRFSLLLLVLFPLLASAAAPVKFSDALYEKFHHERCLQCHQFNTWSHNGRSYTSHRSRYLCDNCHTSRITGLPRGEWMAPPGTKMDYTGLNARDTCNLIKANVGIGDRNTKLREHLLHDARVFWALDNGTTPMGKMPTVPGGSDAWIRDVNAWVNDGMQCD